uniref:Uncharacterized protein n=1 Tax=Knipowitschia caucasica TaxID=637954 RepID=A0AAV2L2C2_KNICA
MRLVVKLRIPWCQYLEVAHRGDTGHPSPRPAATLSLTRSKMAARADLLPVAVIYPSERPSITGVQRVRPSRSISPSPQLLWHPPSRKTAPRQAVH